MKTYHATNNPELKEIIKGHGDYAGIFTTNNLYQAKNGDYGEYLYIVEFDNFCEKSDIRNFLESKEGLEFLNTHSRPNDQEQIDILSDCDLPSYDYYKDIVGIKGSKLDDMYFLDQKLRALIAIKLGFDAVEENDGVLVVNGKVEFLGHRKSEEVESEIEENW